YVINYDDVSGRTDSVTSGGQNKTILVHRTRIDALQSERLRALMEIVREIEVETGEDRLDVEFCVTAEGQHYIVQVRQLTTARSWKSVPDRLVDSAIDEVREAIKKSMRPGDGLLGRTTLFGQMPDWNPAEMIGSMPKPLSFSLYEKLVTRNAWAEARHLMGYRDLRGNALMREFAGQPYIDVRLSLNSFLPAALNESIGHRLIDAQIERLSENREFHDKIEFEIAFPNYDFRFEDRIGELKVAGLATSEIDDFRSVLAGHTALLLRAGLESMGGIGKQLDELERPRNASDLTPMRSVSGMLDHCVAYGIVPFAQAARHAFIGVSLLRSFVDAGFLDEAEPERFLSSADTVAHELVRDMAFLRGGSLDLAAFLSRYGHLRPGTYDITSYRYDERPDLYIGASSQIAEELERFELSPRKRAGLERLLVRLDPEITIDQVLEYVREAVRLRELAKFRFTRTVSNALQMIVRWGEDLGFDREDLSYLRLDFALKSGNDAGAIRDYLAAARQRHDVCRLVRLPHIITGIADVDVIRVPLGKPTYITQKLVTAPTILLEANQAREIDGKIVLIESADPGFDWIFSHKIKGLITKFGGANSHMAIRCAEFRLPAAIGCGERIFAQLLKADMAMLDCSAHSLRVY
ncbi:MAG TPA: PEP-utilizing enzyme, partial [Hyphomicrobiaceae bacterium]|nr:PEP-utilizing enzyme [Hyphomicrobiaceae bacterium]